LKKRGSREKILKEEQKERHTVAYCSRRELRRKRFPKKVNR
jgi:hypothetical protein